MPPEVVGDHGPPRVRAPHIAIPCVERVCGCWSVARSVKTEPEQYQWVAIVPRHPVASVLARVVQAEPAWVRGQTILALGCGSGVAGIGAHDIDLVALAIAAQHAQANTVELQQQGPPLLHAPCPACLSCLLVGDLFSERSTASALWAWLYTAHRQGV